jgi:hypothetical protein
VSGRLPVVVAQNSRLLKSRICRSQSEPRPPQTCRPRGTTPASGQPRGTRRRTPQPSCSVPPQRNLLLHTKRVSRTRTTACTVKRTPTDSGKGRESPPVGDHRRRDRHRAPPDPRPPRASPAADLSGPGTPMATPTASSGAVGRGQGPSEIWVPRLAWPRRSKMPVMTVSRRSSSSVAAAPSRPGKAARATALSSTECLARSRRNRSIDGRRRRSSARPVGPDLYRRLR